MSVVAIISAILTLIAGIGIFLIACQILSSNLESASSNKLKVLFSKASRSRWLGVGIGTVGTAVIQSSGATTVMIIGFVNASIITLSQAATMIYGANIGTTITAQIVALGMFGKDTLSTSIIFSSLAGVGAFVSLFSRKDIWKKVGGILTGFGMLFVGLDMMSRSMSDFAALEDVRLFLATIRNPLLLVLIGAVLTAIIQSSSVMTSIAIAMVVTKLIWIDQGIFLTMGSNIGSCVVAIIAGMTSGKNAKRTAMIHLIFNVSGVVFFLICELILTLVTSDHVTYGSLLQRLIPDAPQTQLAMFHTFFNVTTVFLILPLTNLLVKIVSRIIPDSENDVVSEGPRTFYIDDNMLKYPPVAVQQTKSEILNMAYIAISNFNRSIDTICTMDFSQKEVFDKNEAELNFLNRALVDFCVKISETSQLSEKDRIYITTTFRSIRDIERIGDYAENIVEYAESLRNSNDRFSPDALNEIEQLRCLINLLYDKIIIAYRDENYNSYCEAEAIEQQVDDFTKLMEEMHIKRLEAGICTANIGAEYLSLSSNAERIADHLINVGKTIMTLDKIQN